MATVQRDISPLRDELNPVAGAARLLNLCCIAVAHEFFDHTKQKALTGLTFNEHDVIS
ncbi:hypothetical protein [Pseudomonas aeruginosa]|uniref:hypothetical protein n=1 Tax=Pseudomonas aeruginosa TaxID=287 RepID=UPI00137B6126|nr:hypothetical protein [Pseudomonas aeruginosa]